jgi:hypothetical protein
MKRALVVLIFLFPCIVSAQSVGIGTQAPDKSAILDVNSKSMGLLVPRMTDTERNAIINPARGLVMYCITDSSFYLYNGKWSRLTPADEVWNIKGNTGIDSSQHFIGTTDINPVKFKVNNNLLMQLDTAGRLQLFNGKRNLFIGAEAGMSNTTGFNNCFIGMQAGRSNTIGQYNVFIGDSAGGKNTFGGFNHFVGFSAGSQNISGGSNYFSGHWAGFKNTSGHVNYFTGHVAGYNNNGDQNHFTGYYAGFNNTTGTRNYYSGYMAGYAMTIGIENHIVGFSAGAIGSGGDRNQIIGYEAGFFNAASENHFIGFKAGRVNTTGYVNHFEGYEAGLRNSTGYYNHFSGYRSGYFNTTGADNYFSGSIAGLRNTIGNNNVFVGNIAGSNNTTGSDNVLVGYLAGDGQVKGNRNTLVGHKANVIGDSLNNAGAIGYMASVSQDNSFVIGGTGANSVNVGIGTTAPQYRLDVNSGSASSNIAIFRGTGGFGQILVTQGSTTVDLGASTTVGYVGTHNTGDFKLRTGAIDRLFIQHSTGNIGIGTNSPAKRLHVAGDMQVDGNINVESPQVATLQNNWSNYGNGFANVNYYKDKQGRVYLGGMIQNLLPNLNSEVMFTLAPGYRPATTIAVLVWHVDGWARIQINTDGTLYATALPGWISLEGVSFRAL